MLFVNIRGVKSSHVSNFESLLVFGRRLFTVFDVSLHKLVFPKLKSCLKNIQYQILLRNVVCGDLS